MEDMELRFAPVEGLFLDPLNPRVGRHNLGPNVSQQNILTMVEDWSLEELGRSYLENRGFWLQEALLVVEEKLYGKVSLIVVEGNRRLAALILLKQAYDGKPTSRIWQQLAQSVTPPPGLFERVPYILLGSRQEIQAYLGFRHVTGIKQWDADEKAYFIAKMIDEQHMSYEQVMRMIGSNTPAVRRHYIAYRTLLQIENEVDDYNRERAEDSFSLLYMVLDTKGARDFLQLAIDQEPPILQPVPLVRRLELAEFSGWLFGSSRMAPVISDTREASKFGIVLGSQDGVNYLRRSPRPDIDTAYQLAGGEEDELIRTMQQVSDGVKHILGFAYDYRELRAVQQSVKQIGTDVMALLRQFPSIRKDLLQTECEDIQR